MSQQPTYLVQITVGPVQGFIASARRSRDLWAGSRLLSDVAHQVGLFLLAQKAALIYPTANRLNEANTSAADQSNFSNQLLARVTPDKPIQTFAQELKQRAQQAFQEQASKALAQLPNQGEALDKDLWEHQCQQALDCFVAWAPVIEAPSDGYLDALARLKGAMAARKATRDFQPWATQADQPGRAGRFKSSLDGQAESVLPFPKDTVARQPLVQRLGLAPREELDMLGVVKRMVGLNERFTAFTRIAADPWIQRLDKKSLPGLRDAYEPLVALGFATRTGGNDGVYSSFPFDAALLYPERLVVAQAEAGANPQAKSALTALEQVLKPLWQQHGQPCPYAALLMADGDQMGAFIGQALGREGHQAISNAIARFADAAPGITRDHRGHAIYAGGEDLMLLMPLPGVIGAARALSDAFSAGLQDGIPAELLKENTLFPTLRVGAAICHIMDPYALLRERANAAEQLAKYPPESNGKPGNALGLRLHIRSGQTLQVRLGFENSQAFDRLQMWCSAYEKGQLSGRIAHDTLEFGDHYQRQGMRFEVALSAYQRSLERGRERGGAEGIDKALIKNLQEALASDCASNPENPYQNLKALGHELVLARWLSAQTQSDLGERA